MSEIHRIALPLKEERKGTNPKHGPGGNSTCSMKPKCGAKTRAGGGHPCRRMAGHGTDHLGTGRCKYHGGSSPIKHGLYSKVVPSSFKASFHRALETTDPKGMREHLALLDGVVIPAALMRGIKGPKFPGDTDAVELQARAIDIRSKVLKRQADMEQSKKICFTEGELKSYIMELVNVVAHYVDADTLRKIATRMGVGHVSAPAG